MTPVSAEDIRDTVAWVKQSYYDADDLRWLLRAIDRVVDLIDRGEPVTPDELLAAFAITSALDTLGGQP